MKLFGRRRKEPPAKVVHVRERPRARSMTSPAGAAEFFHELHQAYNASRDNVWRRKREGILFSGSSADFHYRSDADFLKMQELARDFDRNDPVVGQGVNRLVENIVRDGFALDPQTGDPALDRELAARFRDWAEDPEECHVSGEHDLLRQTKLVLRHMIVCGDVFSLLGKDGRIESIESHRCRTPVSAANGAALAPQGGGAIVHGVILDRFRRRVAYAFTADDIEPNRRVLRPDVEIRAARNKAGRRVVLHHYLPKRFSQTRGVTAFAPIVDFVGMHDDLQFATLVKQQIASFIAIIRTRSDDFEEPESGGDGEQTGNRVVYTRKDGSRGIVDGLGPATEISGDRGEKIDAWSPNIPGAEFFKHARLILQIIAINLGLPVHVLLLDPSETNFTGWRGAMDIAKVGFRTLQGELIRGLLKPVYLWKLRQWILQDPALAKVAAREDLRIFSHLWTPPAFPYIEPLKDASTDLLRLRNRLTSPRRIQAERGADWDVVSSEIVEDNVSAIRKAITAAQELNEEFPDAGVEWREILSFATPDGVSVAVGGQKNTAAAAEPVAPPPGEEDEDSETEEGDDDSDE